MISPQLSLKGNVMARAITRVFSQLEVVICDVCRLERVIADAAGGLAVA